MIERTVTLSFTLKLGDEAAYLSGDDAKEALIEGLTERLSGEGELTYLDVMVTDEEVSE